MTSVLKNCDVKLQYQDEISKRPISFIFPGCGKYTTWFTKPFLYMEIGPLTNVKLIDDSGQSKSYTNPQGSGIKKIMGEERGFRTITSVIVTPHVEGFSNCNNIFIFIIIIILLAIFIYFFKY